MNGRDVFGVLPDGREVERVRLSAGRLEASLLTWGATVQDLRLDGRSVVIGADRLEDYLGDLLYTGAIVGRFANRIGGARFVLDGETFRTDANFRARHTLHGGSGGTGEQLWRLEGATETRAPPRARPARRAHGISRRIDGCRHNLAGAAGNPAHRDRGPARPGPRPAASPITAISCWMAAATSSATGCAWRQAGICPWTAT